MRNQKGFVFVTVALLSSVLFAGALSYMDLIVGELRSVRASQNQLEAKAAAEAGVEEVAWECSYNNATYSSANGWSTSGGNKTKTINSFTNTSGTAVGSYTVTVANWNSTTPTITVNGTSVATGGSNAVTIKSSVGPQSQFLNSITTQGQVTMSGNAYTDSYISTNGTYGGANRLTNGNVQTNSTSNGAITMSGNATIKGSPGVGTGGTVVRSGNASYTGNFSTGISNSFPNNTVPSTLTALVSSGALSLSGNGSQTLGTAGNTTSYKYTSISTSGNSALTINGNVSIYVTGASSISNSGNSGITITSGSTLTVYVDGNISISGNGFANNNGTTSPTSFQLYGTATTTSVSISGNGSTSGVISVPQAGVTVSGNGDVYGSVVAKTFTASGNGGFHYDEKLATNGPGSGYKLLWARRTA